MDLNERAFPRDLDEWYAGTRAVCCWRESWESADTGRCGWHAGVEGKSFDELPDLSGDSARLEGGPPECEPPRRRPLGGGPYRGRPLGGESPEGRGASQGSTRYTRIPTASRAHQPQPHRCGRIRRRRSRANRDSTDTPPGCESALSPGPQGRIRYTGRVLNGDATGISDGSSRRVFLTPRKGAGDPVTVVLCGKTDAPSSQAKDDATPTIGGQRAGGPSRTAGQCLQMVSCY